MWRYTEDLPLNFTKKFIIGSFEEDDPPQITDEAVDYINELYDPYLKQIELINTYSDYEKFMASLPKTKEGFNITLPGYVFLSSDKILLLHILLSYLIYDEDASDAGVNKDQSLIDPWIIKDYIRNHKITRQLFNLPKHHHDDDPKFEGDDPDYEDTPVVFSITVSLNGQIITIDMTNELLLGIMAVYRYLHIMHPLSYKGHNFSNEMEEINNRALKDHYGKYKVKVGDDIYRFTDLDFFQGLLTGASWNNLDPHTFITNLQEEEQIQTNPLYALGRIPNLGEFARYEPRWSNLEY